MGDRFVRRDRLALTDAELRWWVRKGGAVRAGHGVYRDGGAHPGHIDRCVAAVVGSRGVASGVLAAYLLGAEMWPRPEVIADVTVRPDRWSRRAARVRRRHLGPEEVRTVDGVPCTSPLRTMADLAVEVGADRTGQMLEWVLRTGEATVEEVEALSQRMSRQRRAGAAVLRQVLDRRPAGTPSTESLLETLAVQLVREVPELGEPTRQLRLTTRDGAFLARVDLCWPCLFLFLELDGQGHAGQPQYDATRQTGVQAELGWLCGRFTWDDVTRRPHTTCRRLRQLAERGQALATALGVPGATSASTSS